MKKAMKQKSAKINKKYYINIIEDHKKSEVLN